MSVQTESTNLRAPMDHFLKPEATTASENAKSTPSIVFTTNSAAQPAASRLVPKDTPELPKSPLSGFGSSIKLPPDGLFASTNSNLQSSSSSTFVSHNGNPPVSPEKNHNVSNPFS